MRPQGLAALLGLGLGATLGSCTFTQDLKTYCGRADSGCECTGSNCCITNGYVAADRSQCCGDLSTVPLSPTEVLCCRSPCAGANNTPQACTSWSECRFDAGEVCAPAGPGAASAAACQSQLCVVLPDGTHGPCTAGVIQGGVFSYGDAGVCGLPGYDGGEPCCYDRCAGQVCGCLDAGSCAFAGRWQNKQLHVCPP